MKIIAYSNREGLKDKIVDFIKLHLKELKQPKFPRPDVDNLDVYLKDKNRLFLYYINGKVLGTIGVIEIDGKPTIKRFFVRKEKRGEGWGLRLFEHALDYMIKHGMKSAYLHCDTKKMNIAFMFYLQNNFKVIDKRKDGYVIMKKELIEK